MFEVHLNGQQQTLSDSIAGWSHSIIEENSGKNCKKKNSVMRLGGEKTTKYKENYDFSIIKFRKDQGNWTMIKEDTEREMFLVLTSLTCR